MKITFSVATFCQPTKQKKGAQLFHLSSDFSPTRVKKEKAHAPSPHPQSCLTLSVEKLNLVLVYLLVYALSQPQTNGNLIFQRVGGLRETRNWAQFC